MEEVRIALRNVGKIRPDSIEDYLASGGYEALNKARTLDRGELIETIEETPDTVVTLINGKKLIVDEPMDEVVRRVMSYRRALHK